MKRRNLKNLDEEWKNVFLFLEPCKIFGIAPLLTKKTSKIIKDEEFNEELFKLNFKTTEEKLDFYKLNCDLVLKMKKFGKDYYNFSNFSQTKNLKDFTNWMIVNGLDILLKRLLYELQIRTVIKKLIPYSGDIVLYKMDLSQNKLMTDLDPMFLIYNSIVLDMYDCFVVLLNHLDGPLYYLKNPDYLFINSYYQRRAPIHTCAYYGRLKFLQFLKISGAKMDLVEVNYGQTILHIATTREHKSMVEFILKEKILDVNVKDQDEFTPMTLCSSNSDTETNKEIGEILKKYGGIDYKDFKGDLKYKNVKNELKHLKSSLKENIIQKILNIPKKQHKWRSFGDDELLKLQKYKKSTLLGAGAFGKVFLALKKDTDIVALKEVVCDSIEKTNACSQECLNAIKLDHPNIVKYNDYFNCVDEDEGFKVFIEMEYCSIGDLAKFIQAYDIDEALIIEFSLQILSGIEYIHDKNMVHRDLKPQNVLMKFNEKQNDFILCIGDFGETKNDSTMKNGTIAGTPTFIAP